jgi:hypothetical protein
MIGKLGPGSNGQISENIPLYGIYPKVPELYQ